MAKYQKTQALDKILNLKKRLKANWFFYLNTRKVAYNVYVAWGMKELMNACHCKTIRAVGVSRENALENLLAESNKLENLSTKEWRERGIKIDFVCKVCGKRIKDFEVFNPCPDFDEETKKYLTEHKMWGIAEYNFHEIPINHSFTENTGT